MAPEISNQRRVVLRLMGAAVSSFLTEAGERPGLNRQTENRVMGLFEEWKRPGRIQLASQVFNPNSALCPSRPASQQMDSLREKSFGAWRDLVLEKKAAAQALYEHQLLRKGLSALKWALQLRDVEVGIAQQTRGLAVLATSFRRVRAVQREIWHSGASPAMGCFPGLGQEFTRSFSFSVAGRDSQEAEGTRGAAGSCNPQPRCASSPRRGRGAEGPRLVPAVCRAAERGRSVQQVSHDLALDVQAEELGQS